MGENKCIELGHMILQLNKAADRAVAIMQRPEVRHTALDYIETLEFVAGLAVPALGQLATDIEANALEARRYIIETDDWVSARRTLLSAGAKLEEAIFEKVIACACARVPMASSLV